MKDISSINIKEGTRIRPGVWPNMLCTMALVAIGCTPYLGYNASNAFKLILFLLWCLSTFTLHNFTGRERGIKIVKWIIVYFSLQVIYSILGISRELIYFLARCHVYVVPVALVYIVNYYNIKEIKLLWSFSILLFLVNLISNIIIGLTQGEFAFRVTDETVNSNAGNTAFVVGCMLLIPTLWILFRKGQRKPIRAFSVGFIAALLYYILFLNTRAISLIVLSLIVLGFVFVEVDKNRELKKGKLFFGMIVIVAIVVIFFNPILELASSFFGDNVRMMSRIESLSLVASQGDVGQLDEGSLYVRSVLWGASINTFVSSVPNCLFGVGESVIETDFYSLLQHGVSNHSEFLDLAARYGILGIVMYIFIIKHAYSFIMGLTDDDKVKRYLYIVFFGVMLFCFVNNLSKGLTTFTIIFIMTPLTIILINQNKI